MNKTISLAAIAMVAVIMGTSAFAPAMADKPGTAPNEGKIVICHLPGGDIDKAFTISVTDDEDTRADHEKHGDFIGISCEDLDD